MSGPGFVNAHTHLYSGLAPLGMPAPEPAPDTFVEILERVWWRLDRALDQSALGASAELYVAEAVGHGCVGLIDHHESPDFIEGSLDVLAEACARFGMPALLCYGATERNGGRAEAKRGLAECQRFIEENQRPNIRGLIGLHASFTVSDETIAEAADLARDLETALHVHVAEDGADIDDARERGYAGVIDRFEKLGAMVPGSIFAHGVHLTRAEIERATKAGCWLVQNPRSNRGNGVGYPIYLQSSDQVALGTDGYPANMDDEQAALNEIAAAVGDRAEAVAARRPAGHRLLARFLPEAPEPDADAAAAALPHIRDNARVEAEKLWTRMRSL